MLGFYTPRTTKPAQESKVYLARDRAKTPVLWMPIRPAEPSSNAEAFKAERKRKVKQMFFALL